METKGEMGYCWGKCPTDNHNLIMCEAVIEKLLNDMRSCGLTCSGTDPGFEVNEGQSINQK